MADAVIIPFDPERLAQAHSVVLGTQRFVLHFFKVVRTDSWYMHVDASDGTRLASGERVVALHPLGYDSSDPRTPQGLLWVTDSERFEFRDPTADEFGDRFQMTFTDIEGARQVFAVIRAYAAGEI